ncbi:MAG: aminopeptidase [Christensenellales bacterium]|jgi:2,5-dihydroxypyridine 5,6-dioxygenase
MRNLEMAKGAHTLINICAKVKPGEQVLVITEQSMLSIAESLVSTVYGAGAEATLMVMTPRQVNGQEPPMSVAQAMKASDVFFCVVNRSITHTQAVKQAVAAGSRGLVLTQFSEKMMIQGGMTADFVAAAPLCKAMAKALAGAEAVHLTTPQGTDLRFSARGRRGNALYGLVEPGEFSTVPTIEANVSPLEGSANGVIVADASIPYLGIGLLEEPVVCRVKDGFITDISGGRQAEVLKQDWASHNDPNVYNIAEMGVGLNPQCRFIGFMLEDEGVMGSVHIGTGTSITLGGTVQAACHYDLIMTGATIVADGKTLLKDGIPNTQALGL